MNVESYKLRKKYGIALRRILTTNVPSKKFVRYLGVTPQEFKPLIALQLKPEFTMDNYGRVWVLDHVVPVFLFDQECEDDLLLCWNYINIIPMPLRFSRLKGGVSLEFALEELELRASWCQNKSMLAALQKRMVEFVASMRVYHSTSMAWTKLTAWRSGQTIHERIQIEGQLRQGRDDAEMPRRGP